MIFKLPRTTKYSLIFIGDFVKKMWLPDTFFANDKLAFLHEVTDVNRMLRLYGDGRISYGLR